MATNADITPPAAEPIVTPPAVVIQPVEGGGSQLSKTLNGIGSFAGALLLALIGFGIILLLMGKNPLEIYAQIFEGTLGSTYGWSEIVVKMTPFILCALAVAIPARLGLINVGGEGQIYIGAVFASLVALTLGDVLPTIALIPLLVIAGCLGGALWGGLAGLLKAYAGLNETISSLLLTYVGSLIVDFLASGPLKDRSTAALGQSYSKTFPDNVQLPTFFDTRINLGIIFALIAVGLYYWLFKYTRWGYKMRVVGGNPEAALRSGIKINRYIIGAMMLGGAMAGLAGMIEVVAIQGRLRGGISNGYGYVGFLVAWLAMQKPGRIILMAALLGLIAFGGDTIQIEGNLPAASVNILMAFILFFVLRNQGLRAAKES
ncbi:MAG: ABC transporter permease [Chloroflexota bacterium]